MQIDGNVLRKLRGQQGISQECLANEIDCSRSIIAKIEKGERSGLCVVYKIAQFFNVTIESLILK
jgi:transcriptional regulator with XRE-family HTH domain